MSEDRPERLGRRPPRFVVTMLAPAPKLPLPDEAVDELASLIQSYKRMEGSATREHAGANKEMASLERRLREIPDALTWSDLMQAQLCSIDLLGDDEVRARLPSWRRRMHEVIGDARYASYLATSGNPNLGPAPPHEIRADLKECISTVTYFYNAYGVAARSRGTVTALLMRFAALALVVQGALGALVWLAPRVWGTVPVAALEYAIATSAAAVIGSVISVQRRLQDPRVDVDPYYRYIQSSADPLGIAGVSILSGAVFGLGVYGLLISGLIAGPEFPKFDVTTGVPLGAQAVALLIVYGFLAGFAEQFVPDALTRIAARTLGGIKAADAGAPPGVSATPP